MEQFVSGFGAYSGLRKSFTTPYVPVFSILGGAPVVTSDPACGSCGSFGPGFEPGASPACGLAASSLIGTPPAACGLPAARLWTGYFHVAILYFSTSLGPSTSASFPSDSQVHAKSNTLSRGRTNFSGARWQLRHHSM